MIPLRGWISRTLRRPTNRSLAAEDRGHRRSLLLDILVTPLVIALIWLGIGYDLNQKRHAASAAAARDTANLAEAARGSVAQALASVDQTLMSLRADYAAMPPARGIIGFDLRKWTRMHFTDAPAFQLMLIDRDGRLANTNAGPVLAPVDMADQTAFNRPRMNEGDALFISSLPAAGRLSLRFARKLFGPNGGFDGVAVMALDPDWLSRTYGALDAGHGFFMLADFDGMVLAGTPPEALEIGSDTVHFALFNQALTRGDSTITTDQLNDGVERIISSRPLRDYPLVVAVGVETASALAAYRDGRNEYFLVGAGLSFCMVLLGVLLVDHKRQLLLSQQDLNAAVENISQGIALIDADGRVPVLNRRAVELCGLPESVLAQRSGFDEIIALQLASGDPPGSAVARTGRRFGDQVPGDQVFERDGPDGTMLEVRTRLLAGGGAVRTFTDITERRRTEEHIRRLAHYDPLTGLANRHLLHDELAGALEQAMSGGAPLAVIFLDLDRFKAVNDTLGHAAGDHVLREVAARLRATSGTYDIIARLGGDEFVVVQTGAVQPAGSMTLAHRLIERVSEPYSFAGQPVSVGTSVGIAVPSGAGETIDRLLSNADAAMYLAKSAGRGMVRIFDNEMAERMNNQRALIADLRAAIAAGEIEVHYQPIFSCSHGGVVGFEALARWTHKVHGQIPPTVFIPMAEENGLIQTLGCLVLFSACSTATTWPEQYRLVINLSAGQVRAGSLVRTVSEILRQTGLSARRMEFEVSERVLIDNTDQALEVFRALQALGSRVALDDFGTGYSSLAYLRLFPFDKLKIDGTFIGALETDPTAGTIVQAIIGMGRTLQVQVAAEGVESELQLGVLRQQRCSEVQGHLLGRPGPARTLGRFLGAERVVRGAMPRAQLKEPVRQVS